MIKYIHGSKDSNDIDVFYVFDEKPSYQECQEFCSNTDENRNIIIIKDGYVTDCFKGTCDEIQNSLITTYCLHKQEHELIIHNKVKRDMLMKTIRVMRCFLSHFSRTEFRTIVKEALNSTNWSKRIEALEKINLNVTEYEKNSVIEVRKVFAFQLAQILGLLNGIEIYTKKDAVEAFPMLYEYLYRKECSAKNLIIYYNIFLTEIKGLKAEQKGDIVFFPQFKKNMNIKKEIYINL